MLVSIRDVRHSKQDRQWIQSVYGEYIESLADLNTGLFSVIGANNPHEDEIFANWFSNDQSHPLLILKGRDSVGFALVTRPRIPTAGEKSGGLPDVGILRAQCSIGERASAATRRP